MNTNDVWQRRALLNPAPNPDKLVDYVVTLSGMIAAPDGMGDLSVSVRYVPDRLIIPSEAFAAYIKAIEMAGTDTQESLATTVLADISNEIVAKWLQVTTRAENRDAGTVSPSHQVMAEDRQPGWDNPGLLAMLPRE